MNVATDDIPGNLCDVNSKVNSKLQTRIMLCENKWTDFFEISN